MNKTNRKAPKIEKFHKFVGLKSLTNIPTNEDIINLIKHKSKSKKKLSTLYFSVAQEVMEVWKKNKIETNISIQGLQKKIKTVHDELKFIKKNISRLQEGSVRIKADNFKCCLRKLFHITSPGSSNREALRGK